MILGNCLADLAFKYRQQLCQFLWVRVRVCVYGITRGSSIVMDIYFILFFSPKADSCIERCHYTHVYRNNKCVTAAATTKPSTQPLSTGSPTTGIPSTVKPTIPQVCSVPVNKTVPPLSCDPLCGSGNQYLFLENSVLQIESQRVAYLLKHNYNRHQGEYTHSKDNTSHLNNSTPST